MDENHKKTTNPAYLARILTLGMKRCEYKPLRNDKKESLDIFNN